MRCDGCLWLRWASFAVLVLLTTAKEFTANAVPILKQEQLMTPDRRIVLSRNHSAGNDPQKLGYLVVACLRARICAVVNSPPQTLQRQPGDAVCGITGKPC